MSKPHVVVYSRSGCHLCEEAKNAINRAGIGQSFSFEEINIETSRELLLKYQFDIPVVTIDGVEAFRHHVDSNRFKELIKETSVSKS